MTSIFKSQEGRAKLAEWHGRFRARIGAPTESRTVPTRYGDTHVLVGGPEGAPPVVLLHGALASSAHLLRELAPLLAQFRVYAVDILGQSAMSADARIPVKDDSYGRWMVEVLDGLGLARPAVVAVSWGGFVATRLAAFAPDRVARLALLVPAGIVKGPFWAGFVGVGIPMTRYLLKPSEANLRAFVKNLLTTEDEEWTGYLGDAFRAFDVPRMQVPPNARPEELARFTAPTLVVAADEDLSFPGEALIARARALFPGLVDTELLVACRHSPPTTDAFRGWMSERLAKFLGGASVRTAGGAVRA